MNTSRFYGKSYVRLQSALDDSLASSSAVADVVIVPPANVDEQTDEEDLDENDLTATALPQDVPGHLELFDSSDDSDADSNENSSNAAPKRSETDDLKWRKCKPSYQNTTTLGYTTRLETLKDDIKEKNPVEIFEQLFDTEILNHIIAETNRYAQQKNAHSFHVTAEEMKVFIGILFFTGYHELPQERLYWSLDEDLGIPFITKKMSRNRYQEIKKYIHLADNSNINASDKMFKLRPMMDLLNKKFVKWGSPLIKPCS